MTQGWRSSSAGDEAAGPAKEGRQAAELRAKEVVSAKGGQLATTSA